MPCKSPDSVLVSTPDRAKDHTRGVRLALLVGLLAIGCSPAAAQATEAPDRGAGVPQQDDRPAPERTPGSAADGRKKAEDPADPRPERADADPVDTPAEQPLTDPRKDALFVPVDDPGGQALQPFWAALAKAKAGKGQARIAWWGASHTAADLWSGHVRRKLQDRFGDAGHGYLLPFRWHGGYRHQDLNLRYSRGWTTHRHKLLNPVPIGDYGYGGVAISSDDPQRWFEIATTADNPHGRKAGRLEIWLRKDRSGGSLTVKVDGKTHVLPSAPTPTGKATRRGKRSKKRRKGRKTGRSVPRGWSLDEVDGALLYRLQLSDGAHTVRAHPTGDGTVYLYGAVLERDKPGVIVDQMGIPGMRGKIQLHWEEPAWRAQLRRRDPHLLIFAYGTNAVGDTGQPMRPFIEHWRRVLERARNAVPRAACLLVGPTDRPTRPNADGKREHRPRMDKVIAAQKEVAAEYGCGYWDAFAAMGGRGSMLRWVHFGLGRPDHVHLSREGYELKGDRFLAALLRGASL